MKSVCISNWSFTPQHAHNTRIVCDKIVGRISRAIGQLEEQWTEKSPRSWPPDFEQSSPNPCQYFATDSQLFSI